jgi:hypothetical protein
MTAMPKRHNGILRSDGTEGADGMQDAMAVLGIGAGGVVLVAAAGLSFTGGCLAAAAGKGALDNHSKA